MSPGKPSMWMEGGGREAMITIRPAQVSRLSDVELEQRLFTQIRKHLAPVVADVSDETLHERVARASNRAHAQGLQGLAEVGRYVYAAMLLGDDFQDARPHVAAPLSDMALETHEQRAREMYKRALACVRQGPVPE